MSNDITFLLAIKDRFKFTNRFLSSFNYNLDIPIIISDGSFKKNNEFDKILKDRPNFIYKKFGFDKDYLTFLIKLKNSIELVNTKYVTLVCDDDFYFQDQIKCAVKFLEKNPQYSMYKSAVKNFTIYSDIINYFNHSIYGKLVLTDDNYSSYDESIINDNILDRFKRLQDCYPYEGIFKTSILKKALEISISVRCFHHNIFIDILRYIIFIYGKVYYSKKYLLARQDNTPNSAGTSHLESFDKIKMKTSKNYSEIYKKISVQFEKLFFELNIDKNFKPHKDQVMVNLNNEINEFKKKRINKTNFRIQNKFILSIKNIFLRKDYISIKKDNVQDVVNLINKKLNG
jgi:glycosyltransferase domain-containing protein